MVGWVIGWQLPQQGKTMQHEGLYRAQQPHTALVVVDMQNDFVDPQGALAVPHALTILKPIAALIQAARLASTPIAYTMDWHPPRTRHFRAWGGCWPVHGVADTWGACLHPELPIAGPCFRKGMGQEDGYSGWSACCEEHAGQWGRAADAPLLLSAWLGQLAVCTVVITGVATEYCVAATAADALEAGLAVVIPRGCCAAVDQGAGQAALERLRQGGAVLLDEEDRDGLPQRAAGHAEY